MAFPYDGHLLRDKTLPWPPGGGLDRAYRRTICAGLTAGRTLLQAELEAFVYVAPAIAPEDRIAHRAWVESQPDYDAWNDPE